MTTTPTGPQAAILLLACARGSRFSLGGQFTDLGYAAGWRVVRAMPELVARNAFDAGAIYASRNGGPAQLRKNLARVLGVTPARVPDGLIRASLASYARYWREAFRLPSMDKEKLRARIEPCLLGREHIHAALDGGPRGGDAVAAQRELGHGRGMDGPALRHLHHRRRAAQAGIPVSAVHRLPGEPGIRDVAADRRRAAAVRGAR